MQVKQRGSTALVGLAVGVLVGGGIAALTPAGAAVKDAATATNWKVIWKTEIKPRADKRYYSRAEAGQTFVKSSSVASILSPYVTQTGLAERLGGYYTKAESEATFYTKAQTDANYYTKGQSDSKYAPIQKLYRGSYGFTGYAANGSDGFANGISFGATFSAPPTAHYITLGAPNPPGCLGSAAAPDALPGNLCVFESHTFGPVGSRNVCAGGANDCTAADSYGAVVLALASGTGYVEVLGSWAARPAAVANPSVAGPARGINAGMKSGSPSGR